MVVSSVSPERCDITALYDERWAGCTASSVPVSVPTWLTFTRMLFATSFSMPRWSRADWVTKRSSPTSCTLPPRREVSVAHPSQSSSSRPSSMLTRGYFAASCLVVPDELL